MSPDLAEARRRIWALVSTWDRAGRVIEANGLEHALDIIDAVDRDGSAAPEDMELAS